MTASAKRWRSFVDHVSTCPRCRQAGGVHARVESLCNVGRSLAEAWEETVNVEPTSNAELRRAAADGLRRLVTRLLGGGSREV